MSDDGLLSAGGVLRLRDAFDRSFAEARRPDPPAIEKLLAIRSGPEPYALRLSEIAGLYADRKITPLPGSVPALLGIAGFRGAIVPVYDLPALLGHRPEEAARWLVTAAGAPIAFAFAALDGHLQVAPDAIVAREEAAQPLLYVREFARTAEIMRPIVHLRSVVDAVRRQVTATLNAEER
ncbi:MAG TPA: chemotaxis protein CheW [Stellaceae bacterium]|nr:chemotaxis protein CheW [Stellaceae bacterium]